MAQGHNRPVDRCEGREVISVEDIARVLAWADGSSIEELADAATSVLWLDSAQACLEDITEATA